MAKERIDATCKFCNQSIRVPVRPATAMWRCPTCGKAIVIEPIAKEQAPHG